jgi:hypothetical protein
MAKGFGLVETHPSSEPSIHVRAGIDSLWAGLDHGHAGNGSSLLLLASSLDDGGREKRALGVSTPGRKACSSRRAELRAGRGILEATGCYGSFQFRV